jgi:hypothetical protein
LENNDSKFLCSGSLAAGFGVALGAGALFIFGEVPRVRNDILRQLPFLDNYYDRTIAPEDNVSHRIDFGISSGADFPFTALLNYFAREYTYYLLDQYDSNEGWAWAVLCRIPIQDFSVLIAHRNGCFSKFLWSA